MRSFSFVFPGTLAVWRNDIEHSRGALYKKQADRQRPACEKYLLLTADRTGTDPHFDTEHRQQLYLRHDREHICLQSCRICLL